MTSVLSFSICMQSDVFATLKYTIRPTDADLRQFVYYFERNYLIHIKKNQ